MQAVASRTLERAESWAKEHGVPKAYGTYEELLADPDIDAVCVNEYCPCFQFSSVWLAVPMGVRVRIVRCMLFVCWAECVLVKPLAPTELAFWNCLAAFPSVQFTTRVHFVLSGTFHYQLACTRSGRSRLRRVVNTCCARSRSPATLRSCARCWLHAKQTRFSSWMVCFVDCYHRASSVAREVFLLVWHCRRHVHASRPPAAHVLAHPR